ncbi:MAG TPA: SBBP repeat-containing protein [Bryobacteraceae bacterium]|nr:SBBP repeat-containing protein [Bryobacteraceae bacterium]
MGASTFTPPALLETAPVRFEPNTSLHPAPGGVRWIAHGAGYAFEFTDRATLIRAGHRTVRLTMPGSNAHAKFDAENPSAVPTNYFSGRRYASVPAFGRLHRRAIYPGIDVVYYGSGHQVEYDFEIAPGADPSRIRMRFEGADAAHINDHGDLILTVDGGEVTQRAPVVYQRRGASEIAGVEAKYRIGRDGLVRLDLGEYNRASELVVDPVLSYTAYLSGTAPDFAVSVAHDEQGFVYVAGNTFSVDFPATSSAYQTANAGQLDVWAMKLDPAQPANPIVYCTYLGGASNDQVFAMTVDVNGVMYLTGSTDSGAFPVTASALISTYSGNSHAFVTMLDPSQAGAAGLIYSTFLGGSNFDQGNGIAVANGQIYVTGWTVSSDFPVVNAYQPAQVAGYDAFIVQIDPTQSGAASEINGTYLGGSGQDSGNAITVDSAGNVYVTGRTFSPDFPIAGNSVQSGYDGDSDAFLAVMNLNNATLNYCTFLGGSSVDEAEQIALDAKGNAVIAGYTLSFDFPITQNAYQTVFGGNGNAFVAAVNVNATQPGPGGLVYSTYYGGTGGEVAYGFALDAFGRYYLGGYTLSTDMPVTADAMYTTPYASNEAYSGSNGFIAVIDPAKGAGGLVYGTYVTGNGTQMVNGIDVSSNTSNPVISINVTGSTTGQVFNPGAQNGYVLKSSVFFFVLQANAPQPASKTSEERRSTEQTAQQRAGLRQ